MTSLSYISRSCMRNRRRTILTCLAVAIAAFISIIMVSSTVQLDHFIGQMDDSPRVIVQNQSSLADGLPRSYGARIARIPGVHAVSGAYWLGGYYRELRYALPAIAVDAGSFGQTFPDYQVSSSALEMFTHIKNAALVGDYLMARFGWRAGQTITISSSLYPGVSAELRIVGIIPKVMRESLYLRLDYLYELMPANRNQVWVYWVRLERRADLAATASRIDQAFDNSTLQTITQPEQAFVSSFISQLNGIIFVMRFAGFIIIPAIILVAGGSTGMSLNERTVEIAALRALGFSRFRICLMLFGETLSIVALGALLGALTGWLVIDYALSGVSLTRVTPPVFVWIGSGAVVASFAAAAFPVSWALSVNISDGLRISE